MSIQCCSSEQSSTAGGKQNSVLKWKECLEHSQSIRIIRILWMHACPLVPKKFSKFNQHRYCPDLGFDKSDTNQRARAAGSWVLWLLRTVVLYFTSPHQIVTILPCPREASPICCLILSLLNAHRSAASSFRSIASAAPSYYVAPLSFAFYLGFTFPPNHWPVGLWVILQASAMTTVVSRPDIPRTMRLLLQTWCDMVNAWPSPWFNSFRPSSIRWNVGTLDYRRLWIFQPPIRFNAFPQCDFVTIPPFNAILATRFRTLCRASKMLNCPLATLAFKRCVYPWNRTFRIWLNHVLVNTCRNHFHCHFLCKTRWPDWTSWSELCAKVTIFMEDHSMIAW